MRKERLWEKTFRYVAKNSPYYRQFFKRTKNVPNLSEIPPLEKDVLSRRNLEFLCVPEKKIVEIVTTSGTTGEPLVWMLTRADVQRLGAGERAAFVTASLTASDTVLLAVTLDRCFIAGLAYSLGLRSLGCAAIRVGPSSPLLILDAIKRFQPTAIVAVPSFLRVIAQRANETGFDLKNSSVRKAICIGEPIRRNDFSLNALGTEIESAWAAKVFSTYGVTELSQGFCECPAGHGAHVPEERLHLEILDELGNPLPDGEVGEVVATTFGVEAMPLLRYRTGDCAAMYSAKCSCGRSSPRLGPIVGRKQQKLKIKGTSVFPGALHSLLDQVPGVKNFVAIAKSESELSDRLEIYYEGAIAPGALCEMVQASIKITPKLYRASANTIEGLQFPGKARKRQWFVDQRKTT